MTIDTSMTWLVALYIFMLAASSGREADCPPKGSSPMNSGYPAPD